MDKESTKNKDSPATVQSVQKKRMERGTTEYGGMVQWIRKFFSGYRSKIGLMPANSLCYNVRKGQSQITSDMQAVLAQAGISDVI